MSYNIVDLIDKLIQIEDKIAGLYNEIKSNKSLPVTLQILAKALYREEGRHVRYYKELKLVLNNLTLSEFDISIYDKVSFLIDSFKNTIYSPEFFKPTDLINFALDIENKYLAVLIDIRGRMVKSEKDLNTDEYRYISSFIKEKKGHIRSIEHLID
jgi:hypothetical protein